MCRASIARCWCDAHLAHRITHAGTHQAGGDPTWRVDLTASCRWTIAWTTHVRLFWNSVSSARAMHMTAQRRVCISPVWLHCVSPLTHQQARHSIHADKKKHGDCHYTVDSPLPHIVFNGLIVRTENLFRVGEQGFAEVTWGVKVKLEKRTGCFEYSFTGPTTILAAGRLISYVHFATLPGNCSSSTVFTSLHRLNI